MTSGTRRAGPLPIPERRPRNNSSRSTVMELYDSIGIAFAAGLFVYLVYALFRPDKF